MSENIRKNPWLAILVILIAIAGFAFASTVATLSAAGVSVPTSPHASAAPAAAISGPLTKIQGSASNLNPTGLTSLGTVSVVPEPDKYNPAASVSVTVTLTPSQSLNTLVNEINDVGSPLYRHFLSAQAVGSAYGSPEYASAIAYFESYGLSVQTSATSLTLALSGTVADMSAAFHTTFAAFASEYQSNGVWNPSFGDQSAVAGALETGPTFYANLGSAQLPAGIAAAVNGIVGLDGMTATPSIALPYGLPSDFAPHWNNITNNSTPPPPPPPPCEFGVFGSCPQSLDGNQSIQDSNFLWTDFTQFGFTCEDDNLCGDYQMLFPSTMPDLTGADNLWSGAATIDSEPDTGQGITIAVVEVGCAIPSDLSSFSQMVYGNPNQLPDRVTQIAVNTSGGYSALGISNDNIDNCELNGEFAGWTGETELDIEYASTMAPGAHIDVIGIPYPGYFSDFNRAYADIAQYFALGSTGGVCPSAATLNAAGLYVVQGSLSGACGVTISSNSYGEGEEYEYFYGTPIYITGQDQELELLNTVGVTNFFASGDSGGTYETVNDFSPAESPGATSVGGAQVTATGDGSEFPVTSNNFTYCDGFVYFYNATVGYLCEGALGQAYWATASGVGNTAYWSYSEGLGGTYTGVEGGGFGQSFVETQPWWQNALDTYSTGAKIDPVISGSAAFNMTIWVDGGWLLFYGGTSFATPIEAGEWALVEEQANVAFGTPEMGDINPLLYAAHNAFEAGALSTNPYTPMGDGHGLFSAPVNSYTWYYYNLSIEVPSAPVQPVWFPSLGNPAGSGWNYLQGLGITNVEILDNALFGQTDVAGHSLANPAFSLFLVTSGGLVPFTDPDLTAGTAYTFEVLNAYGVPGMYDIHAYSGQSSAGAYGGGTLTTIATGSNGQFTYSPTTGTPPGGDSATTYGYFLVTSVVGPHPEWSFVDYAVQAPTPTGTLGLCVVDPYGNCDTGDAETTMFTTTTVGDYNIFAQAQVWLNGLPVAGAVVTQVAVTNLSEGLIDKTLPPASYGPGATVGTSISDARGEATFWPAALGLAEFNGPLYTQVYILSATYDGLVSNNVTVFVEPQSGSFYTGDLSLNSAGTAVTGNLSFAGMKYASFVNISAGSAPGQFVNYTCPLPGGAPQPAHTQLLPGCSPFYDTNFEADVWESGVDNGVLPVNLDVAGLTGPVTVSELAAGVNDVTFGYSEYFDGFYYNFSVPSVQNPIVWQDPAVFLPASVSQSATTASVTGTDTITWAGTEYKNSKGAELASGTLSLVSGAGSTVLATGLSGSYALDTTKLLDGYYSVVFSETAPGAATTTRLVSLYSDNEIAGLTSQVQLLTAQLNGIERDWAAANASVASELSADLATIATLQTQLAQLQATNSADESQIAGLQSQLASDAAMIAQLQQELGQKHTVATPWYAMFGGAVVVLLVVVAALAALAAGIVVGRRRTAPGREEGPGGTGQETRPPGRTSVSRASTEPIPSWPNIRVPPEGDEPSRRGHALVVAAPSPPTGMLPTKPSEEWSRPPN